MIWKVKTITRFLADIWLGIVSNSPGELGTRLRRRYWQKRLRRLGKNVIIDCGVYFQNPKFISIDDNVWIDRGVMILAGPDATDRKRRYIRNENFFLSKGEVYIGENVHVAPQCIISGIGGVYISEDCCLSAGVKMYSFSHHYRFDDAPSDNRCIFGARVSHDRQFMIEGPIFLGPNVGIAVNAVILPGVAVKTESFVSMNSVVHESFEENSLIAGCPAKRVGARYKDH